MGNKWAVSIWVWRDESDSWSGGYREERYYGSQSWFRAAWNFLKAKREGYRCVKLEWR